MVFESLAITWRPAYAVPVEASTLMALICIIYELFARTLASERGHRLTDCRNQTFRHNRPFPSSLSLFFKTRLSAKSFLWRSVASQIEITTDYYSKNFAIGLAFKQRLRGTPSLGNGLLHPLVYVAGILEPLWKALRSGRFWGNNDLCHSFRSGWN